jgi:hypothetical protein
VSAAYIKRASFSLLWVRIAMAPSGDGQVNINKNQWKVTESQLKIQLD